jgi:hypothetical protein
MSQAVQNADSANSASEAQKAADKKERRSLDQRIEEAAETLKRLHEQKRKVDKAQRELNEKELREILKSEKLDDFAPEIWRTAVADIRAALMRVKAA